MTINKHIDEMLKKKQENAARIAVCQFHQFPETAPEYFLNNPPFLTCNNCDGQIAVDKIIWYALGYEAGGKGTRHDVIKGIWEEWTTH